MIQSFRKNSVILASWNVNGWHTIFDTQIELLNHTGADVALLQEVTPQSAEVLRANGWDVVTALELLPADHVERADRRPRFSCAVAVREQFQIENALVLHAAPSPVRTLMAQIRGSGATFSAVSAALPPGSIWGKTAKQAQARAISALLSKAHEPSVIGIDRNGPKHERFNPTETEWWPQDEPSLFSPDAAHGFRDALTTLYAKHPKRELAARRARPNGPLAVSYIEHRSNPPALRRYDVIMTSSDWRIVDVQYCYEEAVSAGSDHALVMAQVDFSSVSSP